MKEDSINPYTQSETSAIYIRLQNDLSVGYKMHAVVLLEGLVYTLLSSSL